jgi:hypothetical protein
MLRESSRAGRGMRRPGVWMAAVVWFVAACGVMAQEAAEKKEEEKKAPAA